MAPRKKLSREERLEKKRLAEKLRYQRIKNDPEKYSQQKEKDKKKYERKKEKGTIKTVNQMTPREKRKARKLWREKAKQRRRRLALQDISNAPVTPPSSDNEVPINENINHRAQAGQKRSIRARRARNLLIKKQAAQIAKLKSAVQRYKKRLQRSTKSNKDLTPNSKVNALLNSPQSRDIVKKKLLCEEVLTQQLKENFSDLSTQKEKRLFQRMISGRLVTKYRVLEHEKSLKPIKKRKAKLTIKETKRKEWNKTITLRKIIERFMEEDTNSRVCAGKKDVITKQGVKKQKRVMLDTLVNLHKLFIEKCNIKISYAFFCKFRPFWVVQSRCDKRDTCLCVTHCNIDLILNCLHQARIISVANYVGLLNMICCNRYDEKCLSRECETCKNKNLCYKEFDNSYPLLYKKWQSSPHDYVDVRTKTTRKVTKCVKSTIKIYPRDLILELESKTDILLRHEFNIVHQYTAVKSKKEILTERDAIIHVDFSENYQTKYAQEVQSFHYGGSREQLSVHTVVVYTKENEGELKCCCYCTLSKNLSHSPPAIWAHLQPILDRLPPEVNNLHFLSDGPVTQYRNKLMFHVLATKLQDFYPKLVNFTWNYHEAGHGKGAPDGVGATCKRTADRLVGAGNDISTLEDLTNALQKNCPNINVVTIDDENILKKEEELNTADLKSFSGTMKVHQVTGTIFLPNRLTMKSLSCFCDLDVCNHFVLGTMDFATKNTRPRLNVNSVYGSETDSDDEPLIKYKNSKQLQTSPPCDAVSEKAHQLEDEQQPSTSGFKNKFHNGDFVLVRLLHKGTEYRYVAMCTGIEEDNEVQVIFCKISDKTGKNFRIDDNDISFISWDQIMESLPAPNLKMKGQRIYYAFNQSINVFEQA